MTLDDLIQRLATLRTTHGNVTVVAYSDTGDQEYDIDGAEMDMFDHPPSAMITLEPK